MGPDVALAHLQHAAALAGWPLSAAQADTLLRFLAELERWNTAYNLTAVRRRDQMLVQHLLDCLAVLPALQRWGPLSELAPPRVLDVGSGGGLPGVVWAIAAPALHVTCVDAVAKKASFITQVAAVLALPHLRGVHARVERLAPPAAGRFDCITSRAFASLVDFTGLTSHLLSPTGCWLAMKGKRPDDEIAALPSGVSVFHVERLVVPGLDAERHLVWMRPSTQVAR
jgi:16S rRNA (guanine527-N7)-methyltransferase